MTINSAFSVNGVVPTGAVAVEPGSQVTLQVLNVAGLNTIEWSIVGNDNHVRVNPTITPSGSPAGATATFFMPADIGDDLGQAYRIQCVGRSGGRAARAIAGSTTTPITSSTTYAIVGVTNISNIVPFAYGEELDRDLVYGWTETINKALANVSTEGPVGPEGPEGPAGTGFSDPLAPYGNLDAIPDIYPRVQALMSVPFMDWTNRLVPMTADYRYRMTAEIWAENAEGACILWREVQLIATSYSTGVNAGETIIVAAWDTATPIATGAGADIVLTWQGVEAFGHPNVEFRLDNNGSSTLDVQLCVTAISLNKIVPP